MRKGCPPKPRRTWEYNTGPRDVSFTNKAANPIKGEPSTSPTSARTMSVERLNRAYRLWAGSVSSPAKARAKAELLTGYSNQTNQVASHSQGVSRVNDREAFPVRIRLFLSRFLGKPPVKFRQEGPEKLEAVLAVRGRVPRDKFLGDV